MAPCSPSSPAIDAGSNALIPVDLTTDQRGGFARIFSAAPSISAPSSSSRSSPAPASPPTRTTTVTAGPERNLHGHGERDQRRRQRPGHGTVDFFDGGTVIGSTLNGSGVATFTSLALGAGTHSITAEYVGTASFSTSTSTAVGISVGFQPSVSVAFGPLGEVVLSVDSTGVLTRYDATGAHALVGCPLGQRGVRAARGSDRCGGFPRRVDSVRCVRGPRPQRWCPIGEHRVRAVRGGVRGGECGRRVDAVRRVRGSRPSRRGAECRRGVRATGSVFTIVDATGVLTSTMRPAACLSAG